MNLTRLGRSFLLAACLSLFAAATSGNNFIYFIYSVIVATLLVCYFLNRLNLSRLEIKASFPDQIFHKSEFPLALAIHNKKAYASFQVSISTAGAIQTLPSLPSRQARELTLPYSFPYRGQNRISNLYLESTFPLGLFWQRKKIIDFIGLSFPKVFEIYSKTLSPAVSEEKISLPRRGVGDDFYGLREYVYGEDSRLINWKLTAKTGKPLVKEYSQQTGKKITITVDGTPGPQTEENISEAASLAKYFIDSGAEVRLVTNEGNIDYGKGLLQLGQILKKLAFLGLGKEIKTIPDSKHASHPQPKFFPKKSVLVSAYLVTTIVFLSLFLIEELNPILLLPFALILCLGWIFDIKKFYPLPKRLWDIISGIVLAFFLFIDLAMTGVMPAVIHLLLFILAYFLLQPKGEHQFKLLFFSNFLVFFLVSGQAINILYFLFFVLYFSASLFWLFQWQDPNPGHRKIPWLRYWTAVIPLSLSLAAISFIFTPRFYNPQMQQFLTGTGLNRLKKIASFSGLTENVELGYFGAIKKNSSRVMRVRLSGKDKKAKQPFFIRVRAAAFDSFDGRQWQKTSTEFNYRDSDRIISTRNTRAWLRRRGPIISLPNFDEQKPQVIEEFIVNPLFSTMIFTYEGMAAIETDAPSAYFDFTETLYFPYIYSEHTRYKIYSQSESQPLCQTIENYDQILKNKFLKLSTSSEKFSTLAKKMTDAYPLPLEKARILESYFQKKFSYSLSAAYGKQNLENFLFKSQAGNCEYFATAMCILLRLINIPSRLAIGFLSTDWNEYGQFFDIRQSDAHAWVEAYIPDKGWISFDPTPIEITSPVAAFALWKNITQFFSALELRWYRYVVGYDMFTQRNFFYNLRLRFERRLVTNLVALAGIIGIIILIHYLRPWKWRKIRVRQNQKKRNFYHTILNRMEKAGYRREFWQTGKEFTEETTQKHPELQPLSVLTEYFYLMRYAGKELSANDELTIEQILLYLKRTLSRLKKQKSKPK